VPEQSPLVTHPTQVWVIGWQTALPVQCASVRQGTQTRFITSQKGVGGPQARSLVQGVLVTSTLASAPPPVPPVPAPSVDASPRPGLAPAVPPLPPVAPVPLLPPVPAVPTPAEPPDCDPSPSPPVTLVVSEPQFSVKMTPTSATTMPVDCTKGFCAMTVPFQARHVHFKRSAPRRARHTRSSYRQSRNLSKPERIATCLHRSDLGHRLSEEPFRREYSYAPFRPTNSLMRGSLVLSPPLAASKGSSPASHFSGTASGSPIMIRIAAVSSRGNTFNL
jgi:hypothetical protein